MREVWYLVFNATQLSTFVWYFEQITLIYNPLNELYRRSLTSRSLLYICNGGFNPYRVGDSTLTSGQPWSQLPNRALTHWGRDKMDDIFKCIFFNENISILIQISLKFVPKGPFDKNAALVQIMAWRRPGDKPLSEPMMVSLLTHKCVTRPQWVNVPYVPHMFVT